jgi:hypothetical protein
VVVAAAVQQRRRRRQGRPPGPPALGWPVVVVALARTLKNYKL